MRNPFALITLALTLASGAYAQRPTPVVQSPKTPSSLPAPTIEFNDDDRFVVGMKPGGDLSAAAALLGAKVIEWIPGPAPVGLLSTSRAIAPGDGAITGIPGIDFIEPVRKLRAPLSPGCTSSAATSTPFSGSGCIAFFDGDPTPAEYFDQPALAALDVGSLHSMLVGNLSIVAVIDTGIDATHPALIGRVLPNGFDFVDRDALPAEMSDGIDNDGDGLTDEAFGHGTHIAGTIVLLNPDARILPLRVLDSEGNGTSFAVAEAIYFAIASGADVINLSLGMNGNSEAVNQALEAAHEAEVVVLAAAGNGGTQFVQSPARIDDVVAVAAVDEFDAKASFSSYGNAVELSAPGVNIYSAMPGGQYAWWSGTSMATSVASGAVSLLHSLSGDPFETSGDELLETSSISIEQFNPGFHDFLGDGRIDPVAASLLLFSKD